MPANMREEKEELEAEERSSPSGMVVHQAILKEGIDELARVGRAFGYRVQSGSAKSVRRDRRTRDGRFLRLARRACGVGGLVNCVDGVGSAVCGKRAILGHDRLKLCAGIVVGGVFELFRSDFCGKY